MKPGPNLKLGMPLFLLVFVVATALLYGGTQLVGTTETTAAPEDTGGPPGGPVNLTVIAKNTAFDKKTITASVGVPVTITLDNEDAGVLHNIAFYTSKAATTKIAGGAVFAGIASENVSFTAPGAPGNYFFHCDVHPDQMQGTLVVK